VLTLKIPDYYDNTGNPRDPEFVNGALTYGTTPKTIRYFQMGASFYREEGGISTAIASNVGTFDVAQEDLTANVRCAIQFTPTFTFNPSQGARATTKTYSTTFLRNAVARQ